MSVKKFKFALFAHFLVLIGLAIFLGIWNVYNYHLNDSAREVVNYIFFNKEMKISFDPITLKHLKDVQILYWFNLVLCLLGVSYLLIKHQKKITYNYSQIMLGSKINLFIWLLLAMLWFYSMIDFNAFWDWIHQFLFIDRSWYFDSNALIIKLFSKAFFAKLVGNIIFNLVIVLLIDTLYWRYQKRRLYENNIS